MGTDSISKTGILLGSVFNWESWHSNDLSSLGKYENDITINPIAHRMLMFCIT